MYDNIGTTAGRVWEYLDRNGEADTIQLKSTLELPNSQLFLALGWLERENKIELSHADHSYTVRLKR